MTETIEWHYLPELPDEWVTLLLALDSCDTDEVLLGFRSGDLWWTEGCRQRPWPLTTPVYAWAHAPAKPARRVEGAH